MLVQKGNHLHNLEVVRQKRGYLVVARANKVLFIYRCSKNWQKKSVFNHLLTND